VIDQVAQEDRCDEMRTLRNTGGKSDIGFAADAVPIIGGIDPPYSPPALLRRRQSLHLRRFARSRILTGQASTPPARSVAKRPICRT